MYRILFLGKGLLIKASALVSAYFELGRKESDIDPLNIEVFTLKGANALGTNFMLPFQNQYNTWANDSSYSSADLVATENQTKVTITPTRDAIGHRANIPFTIILDKGETYSLRASSLLAANHLCGSLVSSNKPIAVTLLEDSMQPENPWASGIDMAGDQLVPVTSIGTEYIVATRPDFEYGERGRIFILTTQPNTNISIFDGGNIAMTLNALNSGVTTNYLQPAMSKSSYIKSNRPIYVFQITGTPWGELGGALVPPLNCLGSDAVSVVRSTKKGFSLIIVAKTKILDSFLVNGVPNHTFLSRRDFTEVTTTPAGEGYSVACKSYNIVDFPVAAPIQISNGYDGEGYFHLGVTEAEGLTFSLGYFSNFSRCEVDSTILSIGKKPDNLDQVGLAIYPNPATSHFSLLRISESKKYKMIISNCHGQPLIERSIEDSSQVVNVEHLPKGFYKVEIIDEQGETRIQKLILE
ncbi:MAG TPA: T9SS type A sorting domain-containing protein [Cytophagaceae bacterium]